MKKIHVRQEPMGRGWQVCFDGDWSKWERGSSIGAAVYQLMISHHLIEIVGPDGKPIGTENRRGMTPSGTV